MELQLHAEPVQLQRLRTVLLSQSSVLARKLGIHHRRQLPLDPRAMTGVVDPPPASLPMKLSYTDQLRRQFRKLTLTVP